MKPQQITDQLKRIASSEEFADDSQGLVDDWESEGVGFESVEPVLRFMEEHPSIDFGAPGPLVHFVEQFRQPEYEEKLLESISRKPTGHTVWMLNRVINDTSDPVEKKRLVTAMENAKSNPRIDPETVEEIDFFLEDPDA